MDSLGTSSSNKPERKRRRIVFVSRSVTQVNSEKNNGERFEEYLGCGVGGDKAETSLINAERNYCINGEGFEKLGCVVGGDKMETSLNVEGNNGGGMEKFVYAVDRETVQTSLNPEMNNGKGMDKLACGVGGEKIQTSLSLAEIKQEVVEEEQVEDRDNEIIRVPYSSPRQSIFSIRQIKQENVDFRRQSIFSIRQIKQENNDDFQQNSLVTINGIKEENVGCYPNLDEDLNFDSWCPGLVKIGDDEEWRVQKILAKKKVGDVVQYRIKWLGWSHKFNTWEPASHLTHCKELLKEFHIQWKEVQKQCPIINNVKQELDMKSYLESVEIPDEGVLEMQTFDDWHDEDWADLFLDWYSPLFRRKFKLGEEPLCVIGSRLINRYLVHLVRIKSPNDDVNVLNDPTTGVTEEYIRIVLSKTFAKDFPQMLIRYYESCFILMNNMKTEAEIVVDAARAGFVRYLKKAKVNINYKRILKDSMPPCTANEDDSGDGYDYFPKPPGGKWADKNKTPIDYKGTKDHYGLPYYYRGEGEGIFLSDDELSSDDDAKYVEVDIQASKEYPKHLT